MNRSAIAAALLCAACGNYSTEDLVFLSALPQREDLRAEVPAQGTAGAATVCAIRTANAWLEAKPESDRWNAGVDFVVGLVDTVRRHPPTTRDDDVRSWGPFPDDRHPGHEIRVVMRRDYPPALAGEPRFAYAFQGRVQGGDAWTSLIAGVFEGPSSARGKGLVVLDFDATWALGMADPGTPRGSMPVGYDRTGDPSKIFVSLYQQGLAEPRFGYAFRGWRDGGGKFGYRYLDPASGNVLVVVASYAATGAGRGAVVATTPTGFTGAVHQCWDANACLVFVDDPWNLTCATPPCSAGSELDCPLVPEQPDVPFEPLQLAP